MAYKNYRNEYDNLNSWLARVPNYEPRETDDVRQVETKLKNQRVRDLNHIPGVEEYSVSGAVEKRLILLCFLQNLLSDIAKKESDLNNVSKHGQLYQQAIKVSILYHHDNL